MLCKETFSGKSLSTEGTGQLSGGQVGHVVLVQAPELNFSQNLIRAKSKRKKTVKSSVKTYQRLFRGNVLPQMLHMSTAPGH